MDGQEFLAKFPNTTRNSNCLEDVGCPKCGQRKVFRIKASIMALMSDLGTDRDESDCEVDYDAYCECVECLQFGTLADFTIEGLDDLLEQRTDKQE